MIMNSYGNSALNRAKNTAAFYRANPHRFLENYFDVTLSPFQIILLYVMNIINKHRGGIIR